MAGKQTTPMRDHIACARPVFVFAVLLVVSLTGASLGAQIIDRVLAVVAGAPITLSDVNAVMRLGLVPDAAGKADGVPPALNALIERQLQLIEVNRYAPPEPSAADIDERIARIRSRFDSQTVFESAMQDLGLTPAQLRPRRPPHRELSPPAFRRVVPAGRGRGRPLLPRARVRLHPERRAAAIR
jgi:hypothetical protein